MAKTGRNEGCPCGSGKKYKQCCEGQKRGGSMPTLLLVALAAILLAGILAAISNSQDGSSASGRVWSPEHGHYHDASGREVPR